MVLRINHAAPCGPQLLRLSFNNGVCKTVDVREILCGPVFEPLHDPDYFAQGKLDPICGTVVWPNGADFAPEALVELTAIEEPSAA